MLKYAIEQYLKQQKKSESTPWETGVKVWSDRSGVQNIEITDKNIRSFPNRFARKYGVDYALKDTSSQPPHFSRLL